MTDVAALIADMVRAGVDADLIGRTAAALSEREPVKIIDEQAERKRTADRERMRIKRDESRATSRDIAPDPSPKETPPTPPKEITLSEPIGSVSVGKARANDLVAFKTELSDLDAERLDAIIKHRRSKNGQLTAHAARLFRRDAVACGLSITEAVDTCISRNWITVKPEYLASRARSSLPRSTDPPRERTVTDALAEMAAGTWKGPPGLRSPDEPSYLTIDASFHRRN